MILLWFLMILLWYLFLLFARSLISYKYLYINDITWYFRLKMRLWDFFLKKIYKCAKKRIISFLHHHMRFFFSQNLHVHGNREGCVMDLWHTLFSYLLSSLMIFSSYLIFNRNIQFLQILISRTAAVINLILSCLGTDGIGCSIEEFEVSAI